MSQDKNAVFKDSQISGSEICYHAYNAYCKIVEEGYTSNRVVPFDNSDSVLYMKDEKDNVMSLLVYSIDELSRILYINIGYVYPEYRGQGLYTKLYKKLLSIRNAEYKKYEIRGGIHISNSNMKNWMDKLNRHIESFVYTS